MRYRLVILFSFVLAVFAGCSSEAPGERGDRPDASSPQPVEVREPVGAASDPSAEGETPPAESSSGADAPVGEPGSGAGGAAEDTAAETEEPETEPTLPDPRSEPPSVDQPPAAPTGAAGEETTPDPGPVAEEVDATPSLPPQETPEPAAEKLPDVVVPDGLVRVAAGKPGLSYTGADKCGKCHRVQLASWAESAHAKLETPLDCEACHGPGSEYQGFKIMKDPEAARVAGLVVPDATFCARCHVRGWDDAMLAKAHAHKPK